MLDPTGGGIGERPLPDPKHAVTTGASLLVVEDDAATADLIERILERDGHRVTIVRDSAAARKEIDSGRHDLVITDLWLDGELSGGSFAAEVRTRPAQRIPVLVLTGASVDETAQITELDSGLLVLHKPFHIEALSETVRRLLAS